MLKPDTIVACAAFIMFVVTSVAAFLLLSKDTNKISVTFCILLAVTCLLWTLHGYLASDVALSFGAGFGTFTAGIILVLRIYDTVRFKGSV